MFTDEFPRIRMHGNHQERKKRWKEDRQLIAALLTEDPKASNRSVANATGTHHLTVASERQALEEADLIPVIRKRRGSDGRVWGRKKDERRSTPLWMRNAMEDSIAVNVQMLQEIRTLLIFLQNRIDAQSKLLGKIRNGRYRQDQPAAERNGRVREAERRQ